MHETMDQFRLLSLSNSIKIPNISVRWFRILTQFYAHAGRKLLVWLGLGLILVRLGGFLLLPPFVLALFASNFSFLFLCPVETGLQAAHMSHLSLGLHQSASIMVAFSAMAILCRKAVSSTLFSGDF